MKNKTIHKLIGVLFLLVFISTKPVVAIVVQAQNQTYVKALPNDTDYVLPNGMHLSELLNSNEPSYLNTGQPFQSAYTFGGTGVTQVSKVVVDAFGYQYISGGFSGTIEYNGNVYSSTSGYDFFLAKLDENGNIVWVSTAVGSSTISQELSLDGGMAMAIDDDNNVYVGGSFVKSLSFLDANGDEIVQLTDGRNDDLLNLELFFAKYDSDGALLWAIGGESGSVGSEGSLATGLNSVLSIQIDGEGYPYFAGGFSGTTFLDEDVSVNGESDFYLASLSKEGDYLYWVDVFGTPENDYAKDISVDTLGYLNVIGVIGRGYMGLPNSDLYWDNDSEQEDTFLISYDVHGDWYFASFMGAGEQVVGSAVESSKNGDIYVAGNFSEEASFVGSDIVLSSLGLADGYLVKYDLNGDALWAKQFGFSIAAATSLAIDEDENVVVLGQYTDKIIFDADKENPIILTTESESNLFMAKFDSTGTLLWAKNIEGSGAESRDLLYNETTMPFSSSPLDIIASNHNGGELVLIGDFDGTLAIDQIQLAADAGTRKVFVAVMDNEQVTSNEENGSEIVSAFTLYQNYPNPFNPSSTIRFDLPNSEFVTVSIYSLLGQKVASLVNENLPSGTHEFRWDASEFASGSYLYKVSTSNFSQTKMMTLIK